MCDYTPFVSTATSLINLFLKYVVLPFMNQQHIAKNHYYTHIQQKSTLRSIVLLVPIIGNIAVAIYNPCK